MISGFTGTQVGMTDAQSKAFYSLIQQLDVRELHHGDCIGADENAHELVFQWFTICLRSKVFRGKIVIHPPKNSSKRAFCKARDIRPVKDYIARNHDIVDETEILIATPKEFEEQIRSGTWATVRYARQMGKQIYLINPDGKIKIIN